MATTITDRGTAQRASGTADITVSSFTAAANTLLVVSIGGTDSSGTPSVSGHGTWTAIGSPETAANGGTGWLFGTIIGGSGSTDTVTVSWSTSAAMACGVAEFGGDVDTSSTVANAVAQTVQDNGISTGPSLSFSTSPSAMTYVSWFVENWDVDTVENTLLHDINYSYSQHDIQTAYDSAGDQTPSATMTVSTYWSGIAIEINESAGGAANPKNPMGHPLTGPFGGPIG